MTNETIKMMSLINEQWTMHNDMEGCHKGNGVSANFGYFDTYYEKSKQYFSILWSIYAKFLQFKVVVRASLHQNCRFYYAKWLIFDVKKMLEQ